jgi:F-type H+-transporting ATPase subunit b
VEALGINVGFLLVQIANVLVIFLILRFVLWGPLVNALEKRRETIEKGLEDARVAEEARANAEKEADAIKANAQRDAQQTIAEANSRAEEARKGIEAEAQQEADAIRASARADAEAERNQLLADMRSDVISLAIAAANRLIGEGMDEKRQQQIVSDFFSKTPANVKGLGDKIEVVSALPLTDAEKNQVKDATGASEIEYKVDPDLLGGLILRAGDKVVDGSVRSSLTAMSAQLN